MKSKLECIPCSLRQALWNARQVTDDVPICQRCIDEAMEYLKAVSLDLTPAEISSHCAKIACDIVGNPDPFRAEKDRYNNIAMQMLPDLEKVLVDSEDRLHTAFLIAVAGNIIDLGIYKEVDVQKTVVDVINKGLVIDDYTSFCSLARPGTKLLYIGDNAGEIVFDCLLVKELVGRGVQVTFVVKSAPISNDATLVDAKTVGLDALATVIETGSWEMGVPEGRCSGDFYQVYDEADIIISKGHANFETLERPHSGRFYLLTAKCPIVADELGVKVGDTVLAHR